MPDELSNSIRKAGTSIDACVFVGGTLIHDSREALQTVVGRVPVRLAFADPEAGWVEALIKASGHDHDAYQLGMYRNQHLAKRHGYQVTTTSFPFPEWFVLIDEQVVYSKAIRPRGIKPSLSKSNKPEDLQYYARLFEQAYTTRDESADLHVDSTPEDRFMRAICEVHTVEDLRRIVAIRPELSLLRYELPEGPVSRKAFTWYFLNAVERHGLLSRDVLRDVIPPDQAAHVDFMLAVDLLSNG